MHIKSAIMSRTGSWSIASRLTLFYTMSTFGLLLLATGVLYWGLKRSLEMEDVELLADKINVMRLILRERAEDIGPLKEELEWESGERRYNKYYGRLVNENGRVVLATPGMDRVVPPAHAFPQPAEPGQLPGPPMRWTSPRGRTFLLTAAWAVVGSPSSGRRLYQLALDVSNEAASLRDYQHKIAVLLIVGIILSAGAAFWITRHGMKPLVEITHAAEKITATQLNERITPNRWPEELTALAMAFDEMLGRLEESFNRLSQFSADLAHELRTPINNLMGEAEVALSRSRSPEEYRQALESNLEECAQLSRMIDNLLFLARADNAETRLQRTEFDVLKEARTVVDFYEAVADEQSVVLACHGEGMLEADPILFRRALSNLVSNALHYTPHGGKIIVAITPLADGAVTVRVSDTGGGIAPEHLPKIFDRFYRVDPSRAQHPQGTGLGLAIVKSIVELHGGTIRVQSEVGQGTVITLLFPRPAQIPEERTQRVI
jgi:two-component system heavy metal sensor histidine kinase CusS